MNIAAKISIAILLPIILAGCSGVQTKSDARWIGYRETGKASFYANQHQRRKTASGELYDHNLKTAAHKSLPLGTMIRVTNIENGKSVVVKVNDRGPFVKDRIVDLSRSAFTTIASTSSGLISVQLEVIE